MLASLAMQAADGIAAMAEGKDLKEREQLLNEATSYKSNLIIALLQRKEQQEAADVYQEEADLQACMPARGAMHAWFTLTCLPASQIHRAVDVY